jgi:hypothetical protein
MRAYYINQRATFHHCRTKSLVVQFAHAENRYHVRPALISSASTRSADAFGIEAGAELEVEIVGRALVVRPVEEARRSHEFMSAFESIPSKRRTAYDELAKGPDQ